MNIFDTKNIDDLPASVKKNIEKRTDTTTFKIVSLFDIKKELSVEEVIVGLYRMYKIEKPKERLCSILHFLKKSGRIEKDEKKGWYKKAK